MLEGRGLWGPWERGEDCGGHARGEGTVGVMGEGRGPC